MTPGAWRINDRLRTSPRPTSRIAAALGIVLAAAAVAQAAAQSQLPSRATQTGQASKDPTPGAATVLVVPPSYTIGQDDVLSILFWREKDMSAESVTVRPDGKVTLPLLNDIQAVGLTPEQLRDAVVEAAKKYVEDPNATVIVKQINSRKVFITGQVEKPGPYPLNGTTTILQLIATAGGLREFADGKVSVMRIEGGRQLIYPFNYHDALKGKNLRQNIDLKPGDTVVVP